jgi:hypothetical protein
MAEKEILEAFKGSKSFKMNNVYDRNTIRDFMLKIPNAGLQNPTALTYNQWNCGMTFICPLFEKIGRGKYLYIGSEAEYTGSCFHIRQVGGIQEKIGFWDQGEFNFVNKSINSFSDWKRLKCSDNKPILVPNQEKPNDLKKYSK